MKLSPRQQKIIFFLIGKGVLQSSTIHAEMIKSGEDISLVTIKRALSELAEKGIVVRDRSALPLMENCIRITVGTKEENEKFIEALKEVMQL